MNAGKRLCSLEKESTINGADDYDEVNEDSDASYDNVNSSDDIELVNTSSGFQETVPNDPNDDQMMAIVDINSFDLKESDHSCLKELNLRLRLASLDTKRQSLAAQLNMDDVKKSNDDLDASSNGAINYSKSFCASTSKTNQNSKKKNNQVNC